MLSLPLKCYDESGVVLPPRWLYWMLALACRDILLVVAFTAIPAESDRLYQLFFPHSDSLSVQLLCTIPFAIVVILLSFRAHLWQREFTQWRLALRPLMALGIVCQIAMTGYFLHRMGWQFDGYFGAVALFMLSFSYMLARSHHLAVMINDWQQLPVTKKAS